jgi:transcriptional regulator of acetoin/glycerol metabolism
MLFVKTAAGPTMPGPRTDAHAKGRRLLAIRWIFPIEDRQPTLLSAQEVVIGRSTGSDVVLDGDQVSRRHAAIRRQGIVHLIHDLDSRNGLFINGARIAEAALAIGTLIRVGEWLGMVVEVDADSTHDGFHEVVPGYWAGPSLWPVLLPLQHAAPTKVPILIEGETGSGKEGVANAVHAWSGRAGKLVAVNCAAIPENLAEGELFGYRKGAFTGADKAHDGYLRAADKGTLFLDEIADLPAALQPKLLRALEQGEITPIGQAAPVSVDVRLVAAVQRPLAQAVKEQRFRPDLYARLDGVTVRLPPLRERVDEIPLLVVRLIEHHLNGRPAPKLETPLVEALCRYGWPYNIRELDRIVQHLVALHAHKGVLSRSDLPEKVRAELAASESAGAAPYKPSADAIRAALKEEAGNVRRAADRLGLSRQQLYRQLESIPEFDMESFRKSLRDGKQTSEGSEE